MKNGRRRAEAMLWAIRVQLRDLEIDDPVRWMTGNQEHLKALFGSRSLKKSANLVHRARKTSRRGLASSRAHTPEALRPFVRESDAEIAAREAVFGDHDLDWILRTLRTLARFFELRDAVGREGGQRFVNRPPRNRQPIYIGASFARAS